MMTGATMNAEQVARLDQVAARTACDDRQQGHEAEHRPVPQPPHADGAREHQRGEDDDAAGRPGACRRSCRRPATRSGWRARGARPATAPTGSATGARRGRAAGASARTVGVALRGAAPRRRGWSRVPRRRVGVGEAGVGSGPACASLAATLAPTRRPPRARVCATRAQLARRRLGIGGVGDRAHDRDPSRRPPRAPPPALPASMPPMAKNGTVAWPRGVAHQLEPDRRPPGLGRGRVHRADADVVDVAPAPSSRRRGRSSICSGEWVERPTRRSGPTIARAGDGVSSWPTCTPSAPAAATRSGRSLRMNSAPCAAQARGEASGRRHDLRRRGVLHAQLHEVDAAAQRGRSRNASDARVADEVQAGVASSRSRRSGTPSVWQDRGASIDANGSPAIGLRGRTSDPPTV